MDGDIDRHASEAVTEATASASDRVAPTSSGERQARVIDPTSFIRSDADAWVLTVQWMVQRAFIPGLLIGATVAGIYFLIVVHDSDAFLDRLDQLAAGEDVVGFLLSPFSVVMAALGMRVAIAFVALASAYPLTRETTVADYATAGRFGRQMRKWRDRWKLARAIRAIRWTWGVRNAVIDRLGIRGTFWQWWDTVVVVVTILAVIAFIVVLVAAIATAAV